MEQHAPYKRSRLHRIRSIKLNKMLLNSIFILAIFGLSIINIFSYLEVRGLMDANRWVFHTHAVLNTIDDALYSLSELGSNQRGYLITNDKSYLQQMDEIKALLATNLEKLSEITHDNPEQNKRAEQFKNLANERLDLLSQVSNYKSQSEINTPEGISLFTKSNASSDHVKALGHEIKSVELILLQERTAKLYEEANTISFIIIAGSIISFILLVTPFILANFELINRQIIEYKNRNIRAHLRQIIESTNEMIAAIDEKQKFQIFNEAYQREFKLLFNKSLTVGMSLEEAFADAPPQKADLVQLWKKSMEENEITQTIEMNQFDVANQVFEFTSTQIIDERKEMKGIVHCIRNITEKIREHTELQEAYDKMTAGMHELKNKNNQITLLVEMSDILLAASSQEELSSIMAKYAQHLLSFSSGHLFIMHPSKNYLELANQWGTPNKQEATFASDSCWAIRLGRTYELKAGGMDLLCDHIHQLEHHSATLRCVPLMAQNDIYGLLYMEIMEESFEFTEDHKLLITAFAELTALALANVRLRENLRYQSIRDPLTGLYNRRYLEDALFKQKHQSERSNSSFAILMLDLDHFKKINDTYGHDAGDMALKEVSEILHSEIRAGDVASRYGGEEFVLMLHNIDLENAKKRAENIRNNVSKLSIKYGAQLIGTITISIGISIYPFDGSDIDNLIEKADNALYEAKKKGRNCVVTTQEHKSKKS